nr:MAG TPA: hypothetical protein [Caudoviricetes sp.]
MQTFLFFFKSIDFLHNVLYNIFIERSSKCILEK